MKSRRCLVGCARHEASFTAFSHSESVAVLLNAMAHKRKGMSGASDVDEEPGGSESRSPFKIVRPSLTSELEALKGEIASIKKNYAERDKEIDMLKSKVSALEETHAASGDRMSAKVRCPCIFLLKQNSDPASC